MEGRIGSPEAAYLGAPVVAALLMLGMALCYATTANIARLMAEELNAMVALLAVLGAAAGWAAMSLCRSTSPACRSPRRSPTCCSASCPTYGPSPAPP